MAAAPSRNSRSDILEAALRLFSDQGFDGVTIRQVAAAADVTSPTIYHFFGDKRGLYREALLTAYERMVFIAAAELDPELPPEARLYEMILGQLDRHDRNAVAYGLFLRDMLDTDASIRSEAVGLSFTTVYQSLIDLIAQVNPALDAVATTRLIMTLFAGNRQTDAFMAHLPPHLAPPAQRHDARRRMVAAVLEMIVTSKPRR